MNSERPPVIFVERTITQGEKVWQNQPCSRCAGTGFFPINSTFGIIYGTCFRCGGDGQDPQWRRIDDKAVKRREQQRKQRERKRKEKEEQRKHEQQEKMAQMEDTVTVSRILGYEGGNPFLNDLRDKLVNLDFPLTANQIEAAKKALDKEDERQRQYEESEDVPAGHERITGHVISTKQVPNYYGPGTTLKMLVQDDRGFKVFGTIPAPVRDACVDRGEGLSQQDRVTFTAIIQPSDDDPKFGFFKAPKKAELLT